MALFNAGLTFKAILFIIINKASFLGGSNRVEVEDFPPEVKEERGELMFPVLGGDEELGQKKWQLKRKAENEVERASLDVQMDWRQLQNLIRKHKMVVKAFKDCS